MTDKREAVYEIMERELHRGRQVYIVYPRIGDQETEGSAIQGFNLICERFPDYKVVLLTSKTKDKDVILQQFMSNEIAILVGTTIVEVGLSNSNANVVIIENADYFGLATLHQIRGRVCRSTETSFCFLMATTTNPTSIARLDVMEKCNSGFEIAEYDLRLRGPGEIFSTRQHGLPDLKFASLLHDYDLLVKARDMAKEYIDKLDEPCNAGIKEMLEIKYGDTISLGETA